MPSSVCPPAPNPLLYLKGSREVEIGMGVFPYVFSTLNLHCKKDMGHGSFLNLQQEHQGFNNKQDLLHRNVLKVTSPVGAKCTTWWLPPKCCIFSSLEQPLFNYLSSNLELNLN